MKLLVTGGNGQLGWELARKSSPNCSITALTRAELDITSNTHHVQDAIKKLAPDFLINTAAYTAVDKAESETEMAYNINERAPATLAQVCAENNLPLIHLSTDYVFDGRATSPYQETDAVAPANVYGASKLAGENSVRKNWPNHIILRVSGLFSAHGNNFVKTILRLAQEKETLRIVVDQITCPTPTLDIADTIIALCRKLQHDQQNVWGTYNYCSSEPTSWFHFAEAITAEAAKYKSLKLKELIPIPASEYPTAAKRPAYSVLDCHKIQSQFGIQPKSWRQGLAHVIEELCA